MVETLGEAWDYGWRLVARCASGSHDGLKYVRPCQKELQVDMETLIWTRGREMPLSMLGERMKCPACGSRRVRIMFVAPGEPKRVRWHVPKTR